MHNGRLNVLVQHIHRLVGPEEAAPTDGQLLERFLRVHEEAAFAELVRRHGPMVFGVCRRILRESHAAEDAFQATFLVLFRRARALDRSRSLANWLYTVAYHAALRARGARARRQRREREIEAMNCPAFPDEQAWRDLQPVLDEELNRLPDRYRTAVVLCHLQGKTCAEAGRLLGCATGTVKSRLARGRELLRVRLTLRGVTLSAGGLGLLLTAHASATVPAALFQSTLQATLSLAAGGFGPSAALAEGVLKTMLLTKLKITAVAVTVLGLIAGVGVVGYQATTAAPPSDVAWQDDPAFQAEGAKPAPLPASKPDEAKTPAALQGHARAVKSIAFSPDGKSLASASLDGQVRLWDVASGRVMAAVAAHDAGVHSVAFSPDGKFLASGGDDGAVKVWDAATGKEMRRLVTGAQGQMPPVYGVAIAPDGTTLADAEASGRVFVWNIASGKQVTVIVAHKHPIRSLAFSPDGRWIATASAAERTVKLWDAVTGQEIRELEDSQPAACLAFSPDGRTLVAGSTEKSITFWDVATGKTIEVLVGSTRGVLSISFSRDGRYFVVATGEPWITLYDMQARQTDGNPRRAWLNGKKLESGDSEEAIVAAVFSPSGGLIASASRGRLRDDGKHSVIRLWDVTAQTGGATRPAVLGEIPHVGQLFDVPAGGTPSRGASSGKAADKPERRFSFEVRNKPWKDVFNWLTDQTGLPVINNYKLSGTFNFMPPAGKTFTAAEVFDIVNDSLRAQKYELIRRKNSILVAPTDEPPPKGGEEHDEPATNPVYGQVLRSLMQKEHSDTEAVDAIFLSVLGRYPLEPEKTAPLGHLKQAKDRRSALEDLAWALMNSSEYMRRLDGMNQSDPRRKLP